ncbi:hypothetical protein GCM10023223_01290 [Stackebrandtia albiflava]
MDLGSLDVRGVVVGGRWEPGSTTVWLVADLGDGTGLTDVGYCQMADPAFPNLVVFPHHQRWVRDRDARPDVIAAARRMWHETARHREATPGTRDRRPNPAARHREPS